MDKAIALAVNFKSAPQELQDAANALDTASKKLVKLDQQMKNDQLEFDGLMSDYDIKERALRTLLNAWDPSTVKS